jgi:hypothetical protein
MGMADTKSNEQLDRAWWDAWWAEDYSWEGLAGKNWEGWYVHADGWVRDEKGNAWPLVDGVTAPSVSPAEAGDPPPPQEAVEASTATGSKTVASPTQLGEMARPQGVTEGAKPRPATLQDYWRCNPETGQVRTDEEMEAAGELVRDPRDNLWHIVHMPVAWRATGADAVLHRAAGEVAAQPPERATTIPPVSAPSASDPGAGSSAPPPLRGGERQTWKTDLDDPDWARVLALVSARIGAGSETKIDFLGNPEGPDGRAQLVGAVLKTLSAYPEDDATAVHIHATRARFLGSIHCDSWIFGPGARFNNAAFSGDAHFENAAFSGDARFEYAAFSGSARFKNAAFSGDAVFNIAAFSGDARFENAAFSGLAGFETAAFSSDAVFQNAAFSSVAWFENAAFSSDARFESAAFSDNAWFEKATFSGHARFDNAAFSGHAWFENAAFSGNAGFESAAFSGNARFEYAAFSGDALFQNAAFSGYAVFNNAAFSGYAVFNNAAFSGYAVFNNAAFSGYAGFVDARFEKPVSFKDAIFKGLAEFHGATVHPAVTFDAAQFTGVHRDLHRAQAIFWPLAALSVGAGVWAALGLSGWPAWLAWGVSALSGVAALVWSIIGGSRVGIDANQEEHMRAFRRLTMICEEVRNRRDAANFYRLELKATRLRWRTNPFERFFSWAYDLVADYGESIARPLIVLGVVIGGFAAIYWATEEGTETGARSRWVAPQASFDPDFIDAARYSLSRVFPFGPWVDSDEPLTVEEGGAQGARPAPDCSFRERLLAVGECRPEAWAAGEARDASEVAAHRLLLSVLATTQSVLAILLGFLFALAVRRRFQIG